MTSRNLLRPLVAAAMLAGGAAMALAATAPAAPDAAKVERGRYLVTLGSCNDCHTPWKMGPNGPEPDASRLLSGHPQDLIMPPVPALPPGPWLGLSSATNTAWAGPWGVSFTANLTPDPETGLGRWTEQQFIDTLRSGRRMGRGRELLPPMPWPSLAAATDEDLKAIFAYLQSLPAIKNQRPEPTPPAPASSR